jgi:hypothetical protein
VNIGIEVLCMPEEDLTGLVMGCYHSLGWGIHLLQYLHWRRWVAELSASCGRMFVDKSLDVIVVKTKTSSCWNIGCLAHVRGMVGHPYTGFGVVDIARATVLIVATHTFCLYDHHTCYAAHRNQTLW